MEGYAEAMRGRYRGSNRTKKGRLLDEFTKVTGYNGKSAHVGQKNWTVVRRMVGYDRYSTRAALAQLEKVHKVYDKAKTSYQRLLEWDVLTTEERQAFGRTYRAINPVCLRARLDAALQTLWDTAGRRQDQHSSVTATFDATRTDTA